MSEPKVTALADRKKARRGYRREYYEANKEKIREQGRKYRKANKERIREKAREYYEANKEKFREYHKENKENIRERKRKYLYNMTLEQYESMLQAQGGVCKICRRENPKNKKTGKRKHLAVDHCHETGEIRGLLCTRCNTALGTLGDSITGLKRALAYLEDFEQRQELLDSSAGTILEDCYNLHAGAQRV